MAYCDFCNKLIEGDEFTISELSNFEDYIIDDPDETMRFCNETCCKEFIVECINSMGSFKLAKGETLDDYSILCLLDILDSEISNDAACDGFEEVCCRIQEFNKTVKLDTSGNDSILAYDDGNTHKRYMLTPAGNYTSKDCLRQIRKLFVARGFLDGNVEGALRDLFDDGDTINYVTIDYCGYFLEPDEEEPDEIKKIADWVKFMNAKKVFVGVIANMLPDEAYDFEEKITDALPGVRVEVEAIANFDNEICVLGV